jgi:hypothetical protein
LPPNPYTILRRIEPPEKCYLSEVLLWRAFGRFPEIQYNHSGKEWRLDSETLDGYHAPIPDGSELTAEECQHANLPDDPRMIALLEHGGYSDVEYYDYLLETCVDIDQAKIEEIKLDRNAALLHKSELEIWTAKYDEYVDQFQAEICLKLRRGELRAMGTKLPNADPELTDKILEESNRWLRDLDVREIDKEQWYSQSIAWESSAIFGHLESTIWIHVKTEDMLKAFPPPDLLKAEQILPIGQSFALASSATNRVQYEHSQRGRPSLPWQDFHIEVARMFRDGQMPNKKEAAIVHIQNWFLKTLGKEPSRAAVGEKLKPYFDQLIKKGQ